MELQIITATLSGGPVGPGDRLGFTDPVLAMRSCDKEGTILRPRAPLTPVEGVFTSPYYYENNALLPWGASVGDDQGPNAFMVLHSDVSGPKIVNVTVEELTALPGASANQPQRYVAALVSDGSPSRLHTDRRWGGNANALTIVEAGKPLQLDVSLPPPRAGAHAFQYYLLAPIGAPSGWALLGELEKIVPLSAKRVAEVKHTNDGLAATIKGVPGESVVIAAAGPSLEWHDATCLFTTGRTRAFSCSTGGCVCV